MKHPGKEGRRAKMGENKAGGDGKKLAEMEGKRHRVRLEQRRVRELPLKAEATEAASQICLLGEFSGLSVLQRVERW